VTTAREEVLARIRAALGDDAGVDVAVARSYARERADAPTGDDLVDLLDERLVDYRAQVHRATPDDVADAVAEAVADGLAGSTAPSEPRIVVPPGLSEAWMTAIAGDVIVDDGLSVDDLDDCHGVVTAAAVAIAETGTIVLDGSPDQGRRAITLVPDLHVCVVTVDQIVTSVPEGVARLDPTRPLTWISGPSATSDIELNRVEGVHGPRTLQVVLVAD
jgi:L-lactate dehydrogenase complex protein LldG